MEVKINNNECLEDLQCNGLFIIQQNDGYRFTSDAVALANFVSVKNNGRVVDLCSGSGVIGILVNAKNNCKDVKLIEIQETLAEMSKRTIMYNDINNIEVVNTRLQNVHKIMGDNCYDVVVCNPPYKKSGTASLVNENKSIAIARHEIEVTLEEIIIESAKLLKFGGELYICNKEERLTDIMMLSRKYNLEPKELKILPSSKGASIVMLRCKKGGKSGIKISL